MSAQNIGETDRAFRIVGGVLLLLYTVISFQGTTQAVVAVISLISIVTGMIGYDFIYAMLGMSTLSAPVRKTVKKTAPKKVVKSTKKAKKSSRK